MGVARKWHFSTSGGAAKLGGVSGDLSEHRGSGIPLLGITSLIMHTLTGLPIIFTKSISSRYTVSVSPWVYHIALCGEQNIDVGEEAKNDAIVQTSSRENFVVGKKISHRSGGGTHNN